MKQKHYVILWAISISCVLYFSLYVSYCYRSTPALSNVSSPVTVIIDAGHGGEDGGAISNSGALESEINLSIAKKVEQLCAFCGLKTLMTRYDDQAIHTEGNTIRERKISDLKNRVALINNTDPAILISIHQNYFPDKKYAGAQVFYAQTSGSRELAQIAQDAYRYIFAPSVKREIKPSDTTYLMKHIDCTGILVECGFLSNVMEDLFLQDGKYQKKIAYSITYSAMCYLEKGRGNFEI